MTIESMLWNWTGKLLAHKKSPGSEFPCCDKHRNNYSLYFLYGHCACVHTWARPFLCTTNVCGQYMELSQWTSSFAGRHHTTQLWACSPPVYFLWYLYVCFVSGAHIFTVFANPKQICGWTVCEWSFYSHSVMKANTRPGSSASFVPVVLSHEFSPTISIDLESTLLCGSAYKSLSKRCLLRLPCSFTV